MVSSRHRNVDYFIALIFITKLLKPNFLCRFFYSETSLSFSFLIGEIFVETQILTLRHTPIKLHQIN